MVCALIALASAHVEPGRPQWDRPITIEEKFISCEDFAKRLEQAIGVPVSVTASIRDRKLTIFAKQVKAFSLLQRVERCLWLESIPDRDAVRLQLRDDVLAEEIAAAQTDERAFAANVERQLQEWMADSRRPLDALRAEREELARRSIGVATDTSERKRIATRLAVLDRYETNTSSRAFGAALAQAGSRGLAHVLAGHLFVASTNPEHGLPLLKELTNGVRVRDQGGRIAAPPHQLGVLRLDREGRRFHLVMKPIEAPGPGALESLQWPLDFPAPSNSPLRKRLASWSTDDGSLADRDVPALGPPGRFYSRGQLSLAERWEGLYRSTSIPIVAEAYRAPADFEVPLPSRPLNEWLEEISARLTRLSPEGAGIEVRIENGWLMARYQGYWRHLRTEPGESALALIERGAGVGDFPQLEDQLKLVRKLTPAQISGLATSLTRSRTDGIQESFAVSKLLGTLSPSERQRAEREGIAFASLSMPAQLETLAALKQIVSTRDVDQRALRLLFRSELPPGQLQVRSTRSSFRKEDLAHNPQNPSVVSSFWKEFAAVRVEFVLEGGAIRIGIDIPVR